MRHAVSEVLVPGDRRAFAQALWLPTSREAKYKAKGFGYVGANLYDAGYLLGSESIKRSGVKKGDRVGIVSRTRGEWSDADLAILCSGGITVVQNFQVLGVPLDQLKLPFREGGAAAGYHVFDAGLVQGPDHLFEFDDLCSRLAAGGR